jgi:trk system potassium uptake protein TrkA
MEDERMKSVLLIGVNRFGSLLARELHALGHQIMAVDKDEKRINDILPLVTDAQIGDSTSEAFLRTLDIASYDICIVTIGGDFQSSLETTSLLKELGGRLVVSRADRDVQAKFLLRNGADEVINPEEQIAEWAAIRYASNHILDYIKLDDDHAIFEVPIPRDWSGRSIGSIDIRKRYGITIMAVKENGRMNLSVTPETVLDERKTMLVLGEVRAIQKCFRL